MAGTILTKKGTQLLVKLMATQGNLEFTRVAIGSGFLPKGYDPASMIDLINYKMDGVISRCSADNDVATITMQISSMGIETGFTMTEIGVFANDPDIGEVLYSYLDLQEDPQYIYAEGGEAEKYIEIILEVSIEESTKVTNYINPASLVTRGEFDKELLDIKEGFRTEAIDFDDSGEIEGIESFADFMSSFIKETPIYQLLANLKAGLKYVLHAGQLVNNCVTDNPDLPLAAAQGKILMEQITQLNSDISLRYNNDTGYLAFKDPVSGEWIDSYIQISEFAKFNALETLSDDWTFDGKGTVSLSTSSIKITFSGEPGAGNKGSYTYNKSIKASNAQKIYLNATFGGIYKINTVLEIYYKLKTSSSWALLKTFDGNVDGANIAYMGTFPVSGDVDIRLSYGSTSGNAAIDITITKFTIE